MTDTTYNGWTNRETWAIGLYLMDMITDQIIDDLDSWAVTDTEEASQLFESYVDDIIENANMNDLLLDLLDISQVNWEELGEHALDTAFEYTND